MKNLILLFFFCFFWVKSFGFQKFFLKDFFWNIKDKSTVFLCKKILFKKYGNWILEKDINNITNILYKVGYFKNIKIYRVNNKVFINLYYKYKINRILFQGNSILKNKEILDILNIFNIRKKNFLNNSLIKKAKNFFIKKYKLLGKYNVKINFLVFFLKKNLCLLKINFNEGKYLKVRKIFFKNNNFFIKNMNLSLINKNYYYKNILNFFSYFNFNNFILDFNFIKNFYFYYGYLDFNFDKIKFVFLNNNTIDIEIYFNEGDRYKIFDILIYDRKNIELFNFLDKIKNNFYSKNMYYKYNILRNISLNIKNIYKERGFLNIDIDLDYQRISNNKIIIFFYINSGEKFYINKIFLKDIDIYEKKLLFKNNIPFIKNNLYNKYLINLGKKNLKKTNIFTSIFLKFNKLNFNKINKLDVIYTFKKNYDNKLDFGINYDKFNNLNYKFSIFKKNFLYLGNDLLFKSIKNEFSNYNEFFFINPINYFNNFYIKQKLFYDHIYDNYNYINFIYGYKSNILWKINNFCKYKFGINYIYNNLNFIKYNKILLDYLRSIKKDIFLNEKYFLINDFLVTNNFIINKLDNNILPKYGYYINYNNKFTFLNSDNNFYKTNISWFKYLPITKNSDWIFFIHNYIGYGNGFGNKKLPFYENFYSLENNYLRVFDKNIKFNNFFLNTNKYKKCKNNVYSNCNFGGNLAFSFTNELILPNKLFFNNYYSKYFRTSLFLDSGFIMNTNNLNKFNIIKIKNNIKNILKVSTGISLKFITSIGSINISYGIPLLYNNSDKINNFQFSIGNIL